MAGTACTKTVSFIAKISQHAMHILCKNVRVHFPDVHVMHCFHQSFRRAGKKAVFSFADKKKKRKKNDLVNFPHDFYFLQEDGVVFHLLVHILHTAHLFLKILRKPHHGINWMSRVLHLRSPVWQLSVSTIIHCLCQLSTCLDFCVIEMLLVRKENKCMPWNMTQNWLKTWG